MDLSCLRVWFDELLSLLWPRVCEVCHRSLTHDEDGICLHCLLSMPRTEEHTHSFGEMHKRLGTHAPIERCAAYFHYISTDPYSRLILAAKYHHRPIVARKLAEGFATELLPTGFFDGIDAIVPVPIHYTKRIRRGYNQTEWIARGLADVTGIAIAADALRCRRHLSQTHYGPIERMANAQETYTTHHIERLDGLHLLLVDDVMTTGATLTACAEALHRALPAAKLSVLTLGLTRHS